MKGLHVQHGFTLIETIIVVVLMGVMMAGMTQLFVTNIARSHEPLLRQKALAVADALMDEIIHKAWDEQTPLGGGCVATGTGNCPGGPVASGIRSEETLRIDYDDIDDYNSIRNQSPPHDASDQPIAEYRGYSVSVFVDQITAWNGIPAGDIKRIRVQVTSPIRETITLTGYRANS